jgi:signal transduction histidine kinase
MFVFLGEWIQKFELPSLIFVALTTIVLGAIVFYRIRRSASGVLFVLLSLSFTTWSIVNYFSLNPPAIGDTLLWARLVLCVAAPQAMLFALLMHTLPAAEMRLKKGWVALMTLVLFIQMGSAISPYVFTDIQSVGNTLSPVVGWGMVIYMPIMIFFFGLGIFWLIKKFVQAEQKERRNLLIILWGFGSMIMLLLVFLLFAVVFFNNTTFIPISPLFVLPFIVSTGYTLTRQEFLHIRLIATEFVTSFLTIALLTEALLSENLGTIVWKTVFAVGVSILGFLLIKSVHKEIKQRKELFKLAKNLEDANVRLKELDDLKTEFLSIATHQLRTPLSIIKGYIELIEDGIYGKPSKKLRQVLHDMDVSNERLVKLVDEFLDVTRIEQGRTQYHFEKMDFGAMVKDVLKELTEKASQKQIVFKDTVSGKTEIIGDSDRLRHGVFNFVDNAIKYSPAGSVVNIEVSKEKTGVAVRVKDQGPGLDQKDINNLFQKFYRSPNVSRDFEGTGLGIYVCRMFIEAHGGHVWADSKGIGKGSEFGFWVPEKQENA